MGPLDYVPMTISPMKWLMVSLFNMCFAVYKLLLITRIVLSWLPHNPNHKAIRFINVITEPVLVPFRKIFGAWMGMIDFSPILAFFFLEIVESVLVNLLIYILNLF